MKFSEVVAQTLTWLQREGRVSYRALKREFELDDDFLQDLKAEIIEVKELAVDKDGKILVWAGRGAEGETAKQGNGETVVASSPSSVVSSHPLASSTQPADGARAPLQAARTDGERRQLTVMFIDLVGSTTLSQQLDPEDYHARVVAYQAVCHQVIARYEGHIAQYLGDGVLVYFGYPIAHEEDAVRAVRSGLEIVAAVSQLEFTPPLQVRIGIHTGPVVVGEIGAGERTERLALGETPNLAARVQGVAEPDTVFISQATYRLVQGFFTCEVMGPQELKNVAAPVELYRVQGEGEAHTRFEVSVQKGLTPLIGRESELELLRQRWAQAKAGAGQVVLLCGEPGIGKSRLVQECKEQFAPEGVTRIEFRCSAYYQNSAFYPIIEHLQRLLQFQREEMPQAKLTKLQQALMAYRFPQADTLQLLATLLSLPQPEGMAPLTLSPQKQKQRTQEALVAWLMEEAEKATVYCAWEDVHWADPSTLEVLTLLFDQVPTRQLLVLLTFRPEFPSSWGNRSHLSQLTLGRLGRPHVETMVESVTRGKALPTEVVQQIVAKTDGVPLFIEELTKTVVESGLLRDEGDRYVGAHRGTPIPPLAIPSTLQDSLMARLDRLAPVKEIAQLGATLGREFSYELLHAVSPLDEGSLQQGLQQLVAVELLYSRGLPPQATYLFKHALIQDTAYQSLLKSKRQQYHQQIARVLEEQFAETKKTQPELVAHHYTEAGLAAQAIPYWQRAGERASQRPAYVEAVAHLTKGLELLKALPDTPERVQQELTLQITLSWPLMWTKGASPEVEQAYTRARELCRQVGETPQLVPVLMGLVVFYTNLGKLQTALELGEQLLSLAQRIHNPAHLLAHLLWSHYWLGMTLFYLGEFVPSREHLEQGIASYDLQQYRSLAPSGGFNPGVSCLSFAALVLWLLGYPDQALKRNHEALTLAQRLAHPDSLALAQNCAAWLHMFRREGQAAQEWAEALITLSTEQGFAQWVVDGTTMRVWALTEQGKGEEGIAQMHQSLAASQAMRTECERTYWLALLAEAHGKVGEAEQGLAVLVEARAQVEKTGERFYEAELYRLKGTLTLQSKIQGPTSRVAAKAEECFWKALEIAQKQQAKSLELRASTSLAHLWQQQGKTTEALRMLSEVYGWFTEGFDTKDLQEAKALLESLGSSV